MHGEWYRCLHGISIASSSFSNSLLHTAHSSDSPSFLDTRNLGRLLTAAADAGGVPIGPEYVSMMWVITSSSLPDPGTKKAGNSPLALPIGCPNAADMNCCTKLARPSGGGGTEGDDVVVVVGVNPAFPPRIFVTCWKNMFKSNPGPGKTAGCPTSSRTSMLGSSTGESSDSSSTNEPAHLGHCGSEEGPMFTTCRHSWHQYRSCCEGLSEAVEETGPLSIVVESDICQVCR
mmetsp:Transcript_14868/g.25414  ORF Transcript_14868/g.25414 Transcript_14868/m.25414 type:complete len:232 (-) Transcript_14868:23-718(-)